jgi:hypothetical protein
MMSIFGTTLGDRLCLMQLTGWTVGDGPDVCLRLERSTQVEAVAQLCQILGLTWQNGPLASA